MSPWNGLDGLQPHLTFYSFSMPPIGGENVINHFLVPANMPTYLLLLYLTLLGTLAL